SLPNSIIVATIIPWKSAMRWSATDSTVLSIHSEAKPCISSACAKRTAGRLNGMLMKPKIYMPTEEEDREINCGIEADPVTYVPNDEAFSKMSRRGRPKSETPKVQLT